MIWSTHSGPSTQRYHGIPKDLTITRFLLMVFTMMSNFIITSSTKWRLHWVSKRYTLTQTHTQSLTSFFFFSRWRIGMGFQHINFKRMKEGRSCWRDILRLKESFGLSIRSFNGIRPALRFQQDDHLGHGRTSTSSASTSIPWLPSLTSLR